ncbi:hypothetical protein C8Q74DRAFT_1367884 [Fomes fomentarius]|nr:hypothetical protein C8Q74DRAFT_1367884 [Fomes fomentarius]
MITVGRRARHNGHHTASSHVFAERDGAHPTHLQFARVPTYVALSGIASEAPARAQFRSRRSPLDSTEERCRVAGSSDDTRVQQERTQRPTLVLLFSSIPRFLELNHASWTAWTALLSPARLAVVSTAKFLPPRLHLHIPLSQSTPSVGAIASKEDRPCLENDGRVWHIGW